MNVTAIVVNVTAVNVSWIGLEHLGWNVSHYTLYYTASSAEKTEESFRRFPANTISVIIQLLKRAEQTQFQFYLSANVGMYEGPQSEKVGIVFGKYFTQ